MERIQLGRKFYELGLELGRAGTVAIGSGGGTLARALARTAGCAAAPCGRCRCGRRSAPVSGGGWGGRVGGAGWPA